MTNPSPLNRILLLLLAVAVIGIVMPQSASAGQGNSISSVICEVVGWLWGPVGTAVAMLGIVALGLSAMFGKIAIPNVLITMAGITMIFGAQNIVTTLGLTAGCSGGASATAIMSSPLMKILACIVHWFSGPMGRALATLAVLTMGLFAMNGRISYHQAMIVGVGIALVLGSFSILQSLGIQVATGNGPGYLPLGNICPTGQAVVNSFEIMFCNVVSWSDGPIGRGVGTLALVIMGVGALYGKVSWGVATVTGIGIALFLGAGSIVSSMGGSGKGACHVGNPGSGQGTVLQHTPSTPTLPPRPIGPVVLPG